MNARFKFSAIFCCEILVWSKQTLPKMRGLQFGIGLSSWTFTEAIICRRIMERICTDIQIRKIPQEFKYSKIIDILRPTTSTDSPKSYRLITVMLLTDKLLKRIIYNRISPLLLGWYLLNRQVYIQVRNLLTKFYHSPFKLKRNSKCNVKTLHLSISRQLLEQFREGMMYKILPVFSSISSACGIVGHSEKTWAPTLFLRRNLRYLQPLLASYYY